jgi:hypothetical protein
MENAFDLYTISFIVLLCLTLATLVCFLILRIAKIFIKSYQKNARREARRKMRKLRNDMIKNNINKNTSAML